MSEIVTEYGHSKQAAKGSAGGLGARYYISGPPRMVADLNSLLLASGVPEVDIAVETFRGGAAYDMEADMQATSL